MKRLMLFPILIQISLISASNIDDLINEADRTTARVRTVLNTEHPSTFYKIAEQLVKPKIKPVYMPTAPVNHEFTSSGHKKQYVPDTTSYVSNSYTQPQPTIHVHNHNYNHQTYTTPAPEPVVIDDPVQPEQPVQPVDSDYYYPNIIKRQEEEPQNMAIMNPVVVPGKLKWCCRLENFIHARPKTSVTIMIGAGLAGIAGIGGIIYGYLKSSELKEYKSKNLSKTELSEKLMKTEEAMFALRNQIAILEKENNIKLQDIAVLRRELAELNDLTIRLRNALAEATNYRR